MPTHPCQFKACSVRVNTKRKYCSTHRSLNKRKGIDGRVGKMAWNWRGGISDYPNHHLFRINRKAALLAANNICKQCNGQAKQVHHIDGSKTNHAISNLMPICTKCHYALHKGRKNGKSKYRQKYGFTITEIFGIMKKFGMNDFYFLDKKGILGPFLKNYRNSLLDAAKIINQSKS